MWKVFHDFLIYLDRGEFSYSAKLSSTRLEKFCHFYFNNSWFRTNILLLIFVLLWCTSCFNLKLCINCTKMMKYSRNIYLFILNGVLVRILFEYLLKSESHHKFDYIVNIVNLFLISCLYIIGYSKCDLTHYGKTRINQASMEKIAKNICFVSFSIPFHSFKVWQLCTKKT
jgi:hypothetical protein